MRSAPAVAPPVDEGGFFRKLSVAIMGDDSTAQLEDDIAALRSAHADGDGADGNGGGGGGGGVWRRMSAAVAEVFGDDDADLERAAADNLGQTDPMAAAVMRSQQGGLLSSPGAAGGKPPMPRHVPHGEEPGSPSMFKRMSTALFGDDDAAAAVAAAAAAATAAGAEAGAADDDDDGEGGAGGAGGAGVPGAERWERRGIGGGLAVEVASPRMAAYKEMRASGVSSKEAIRRVSHVRGLSAAEAAEIAAGRGAGGGAPSSAASTAAAARRAIERAGDYDSEDERSAGLWSDEDGDSAGGGNVAEDRSDEEDGGDGSSSGGAMGSAARASLHSTRRRISGPRHDRDQAGWATESAHASELQEAQAQMEYSGIAASEAAVGEGEGGASQSDGDTTAHSAEGEASDGAVQGEEAFDPGDRFRIMEAIGEGAYGTVVSAEELDPATGQVLRHVAIKKIHNVFSHQHVAVRTLREVSLMRMLPHENIIRLECVLRPRDPRRFGDVYLVLELMETDLSSVIKSPQPFSDSHIQFFIYQILRGLKWIHTANVIHRDLKPRNILVNANCDLKICDFGLARVDFAERQHRVAQMTDYVASRWYRAPEVLLTWKKYTKAIDMWSVGCILAELLGREPLFPGADSRHQLDLITQILGSPSEHAMANIKVRADRSWPPLCHI